MVAVAQRVERTHPNGPRPVTNQQQCRNFPVDSSIAGRTSMRQQGRGRYSCRGMQGAFMNGVAILFAAAVFATVLFAIIATVAAPAEVRDEDGWR